jgi:hypothetical protein
MATAILKPRRTNPDSPATDLAEFIPEELREIGDAQVAIPRIARDARLSSLIECIVPHIPTSHDLYLGDARQRLRRLAQDSVHLVVTSPPYWTLKEYRECDGQLGCIADL